MSLQHGYCTDMALAAALAVLTAASAASASAAPAVASVAPTVSAAPPLALRVATPGLTIVFNASAGPISLKNAQGDELLGAGSPGFSLKKQGSATGHPTAATTVRFDTIAPGPEPMAYIFGVSGSSEQLSVTFGGANHYLTANITSTHGFQCNTPMRRYQGHCTTVSFDLTGRQRDTLRGMSLNFMINDHTGEGHSDETNPMLLYEAPWENSTWNPRPRFAVYERVDDNTEDDTLYDLWVDEGVAHPRVNGTWDRARARAWIQEWTAATYDMSHIAMVPRNLSEWRAFFPYAKLMDAKSLWFNFRTWAGSSIDNVDPKMFPSGVAGFKAFSDDAVKNGQRITTHRMSGGLMPTDPDYCVRPDPGLAGWGDMTLVSAATATDSRIVVKPQPGVKIPVMFKPHVPWQANISTDVYEQVPGGIGACSIADEMLSYMSITPLPDGNWAMEVTRRKGTAHPAGALVRGYEKGNEYFIPDLYSNLYEAVAVRYANFSNLVGFDDGSFDGAAWFAWYGRWGFYKFASLVYQNLDHPTAVHTSGVVVSPAWMEYVVYLL